jgi:hypothetical protein
MDRALATGLDGSEVAGLETWGAVPDSIHARVLADQRPGSQPVPDLIDARARA